jgi:hypothetical protein
MFTTLGIVAAVMVAGVAKMATPSGQLWIKRALRPEYQGRHRQAVTPEEKLKWTESREPQRVFTDLSAVAFSWK